MASMEWASATRRGRRTGLSSRRAGRLLRVREHLESVLASVDVREQQELADDVIVALKAVDQAYERETGKQIGTAGRSQTDVEPTL